MVLGKLDSYMQKNETRPLITRCIKTDSKWIEDSNVRLEAIKLLDDNKGSTFSDVSLRNTFLGMSPQAREIKRKINKMGLHQTKKLLLSKGKLSTKQKDENHGHGEQTCGCQGAGRVGGSGNLGFIDAN